MIDTDKYTGHTEGPWWAGEWFTDGVAQFERGYGVEQRIVNESPFVDHSGKWVCLVDNEADSKLIADAPLLLADNKRMREENSILKNALRSLVNVYELVLPDKHAEVWYEVNRILEGDEL